MTPEEIIAELDRLGEGTNRAAFIVLLRASGGEERPQDSTENVCSEDPDRLADLKERMDRGAEPIAFHVREVNRAGTLTVWSKLFDETNERHVSSLRLWEHITFMKLPLD